jgi:hypothetical protein
MTNPKSASGAATHRRVSRLRPVEYQISLIYLGDTRIRARMDQDPVGNMVMPPPYRCRYQFLEHTGADGAERPVAPLTPLPNVVRESDTTADDTAAAKFFGAGGTAVNPPNDRAYKIMITDNHGTRAAENLDLLGDNGDTNSNPSYYKTRGWIGDVIPAVPFRIIVRRIVGGQQMDVPAGLKVAVQVKDAKEEVAQNDGRRRQFLDDFFKKYNRVTGTATAGDDNLPARFGLTSDLAREANQHGYNATKVLRKLTYASPPLVDTSSAALAQQEWGATSAASASAQATRGAEFTLELKDDTTLDGRTVKAGVADFVFTPFPGGGDNYRFLLGLFKGSDDIRDTRDQSRSVIVVDDQRTTIVKPRHYVTPRMVIWRKIEYALCVLANNLGQDALNWNDIIAMYRKCFVEVARPLRFHNLTRQAWRDLLRSKVPQNAGTTPIFNNDAHWTDAAYSTSFYPAALQALPELAGPNNAAGNPTGRNARNIVVECMKTAVANACTALGLPNPGAGDNQTKQHDPHGAFMFVCHDASPTSVLGSYDGDRMFWFCRPTNNPVANATSTGAHEFAHLRSIRHAITDSDTYNFTPLAGAAKNIDLFNPRNDNVFHLDHDGRDAFACLQSYRRPLNAEPCGFCALLLRFYDRTEIQKVANYKAEIDHRYRMSGDPPVTGAVILARITGAGAGNTLVECTGGNINLAVGSTVDLVALGPEVNYTDRGGTNADARLNLTWYRPQPITGNGFGLWTKQNNRCSWGIQRDQTSGVCVRLTAVSAGTCRIDHAFDGATVSCTITVP